MLDECKIGQRLGLLQIERVEAFGEPAVDRCEKIAGPGGSLRPARADGRLAGRYLVKPSNGVM
jgi:hypothetical protein